MGIIYSKCHNGVIRVPGFADDTSLGFQMLVPGHGAHKIRLPKTRMY